MKISKNILCILFIGLFTSFVFSKPEKKDNIKYLNKDFYKLFLKSSAIERDGILSGLQNEIVQGRGYVDTVETSGRYHRRFRITAIDSEAHELNIRLFLYTDNEEYLTLLKKGDIFDYRGQFVIFTPLSSRKDSYIFDIILEEVAININ